MIYEGNNINSHRKQNKNEFKKNNQNHNINHQRDIVQVNRRDGASQKGTQSNSKEIQDVFKKER